MPITARRILAALLATAMLLISVALPSRAEPPVDIPPGTFVIDNSGVLGGASGDIEEELSHE